MRIAYLECFSGISGDMFLAALVDAGVTPELLKQTVEALGVDARLEVSRVDRSGISAVRVDVIAAGEKELPREEFWEQQSSPRPEHHAHELDHVHERAHGHRHERDHAHDHSHPGHGHHRGLKEIREIISRSEISPGAKTQAIRMFEALGTAEAKVHDKNIEDVHFHEVGAVDAIVDIVCAAVGAEALGVDEWICSPLNVGGGTVTCAHGTFPIPAPATLELLKNAPVYSNGIQKELVTPTGAAIVSVLASSFSHFPRMKTEKIAYGAGTRDLRGFPNVVRVSVGESTLDEAAQAASEEIVILEANVDDMTPQVFGYVMERSLEAGALDAFATAVQMKKNRPGMLLTILCRREDSSRLQQLVFAETTTLGVRERRETRATLSRRHVNVQTKWGEVRMKLASMNGNVTNYAPEYEDCRRIAEQHGVPLKAVMQEAIRVYLERNNG